MEDFTLVMYLKKRSDGSDKAVEGTDNGELYVILCGLAEGGDVKPLRVDENGQIILAT